MNGGSFSSTEAKTQKLLGLFKKKQENNDDDGLIFISGREEAKILQNNELASSRKRKKPSNEHQTLDELDRHPEWKKGKKDIREISTVLPLAELLRSKKCNINGPIITPMMVEYFHDYLQKNPKIQRIAVLGFNSGYTTETFLKARDDITVMAFDPLIYPYVGRAVSYLNEKYPDRFTLIGGVMSKSIDFLKNYLGSKRFDMIYIDSGSYHKSAENDLFYSRYLAHAKTVVFMENVKPYSGTGAEVFRAWDTFVQNGDLRETEDPCTWEELNRCLCQGVFVAGDKKPLAPGEISRVRRFWETDPNALLWKYGNELKKASPDRAMELWEEMIQKGLPLDTTAKNFYVEALKKGGDRKYQQEIERIQNIKFLCVFSNN